MHASAAPTCEGVIVLSPSFQVLYMSPGAVRLIESSGFGPTPNPSEPTLPPALHCVGQETRDQLQSSLRKGNGLACEIERRISTSGTTLFVRGLGTPNHDGREFLTVLVVSKSPIESPFTEFGQSA